MLKATIPPPDLLKHYDHLAPGTAARLIQLVQDEVEHRHAIEQMTVHARIEATRREQAIAQLTVRNQRRSIQGGRLAGVLIALISIAASCFLALQSQTAVAIALTAVPSAAVIRAFLHGRHARSD